VWHACVGRKRRVVLTYGAMVHESLKAAEKLAADEGYEVMVVDMRTLKPYDVDTVITAVAATNRVMVVHEAGGRMGSVRNWRQWLRKKLPSFRCSGTAGDGADIPIPFAPELEMRIGRTRKKLRALSGID